MNYPIEPPDAGTPPDSASGSKQTSTNIDRERCWSGVQTASAFRAVVARFEPTIESINALNVFPVPDGDTGTNMYQTLLAALGEIDRLDSVTTATAGDVLVRAAHGALMGARGNSGVILYQILAGFAAAVADADEIDGVHFADGLRRASELAYQAVVKPVEGTMLTVIRRAAEAAESASAQNSDIAPTLDAALHAARETLAQTPEMLPILKQAGVVDAGGQGLVTVFEGLKGFLAGEDWGEHAAGHEARGAAASMAFLDHADIIHDLEEYGYCTNFVLTGNDLPHAAIRERLDQLGTSAVIVGDVSALKVHIHSDHPGLILEAALEYGQLRDVRIDNMAAQTEALLAARARRPQPATSQEELSGIAIVAIANGDGLAAALKGLGAAAVVGGGPSFNPSTDEILRQVRKSDAPEVIILPNDPNVIATARQVEKLTDRVVRVVPTTSVPQGIAALAAFNVDAGLDENVEAMTAALEYVRSLAITRASRDANIEGVEVRSGQYIGLIDGQMAAAGDDPVEVVHAILSAAGAADFELLTVFVGQPAGPDESDRLAAMIDVEFPNLTLEMAEGGQPHYSFIMALE